MRTAAKRFLRSQGRVPQRHVKRATALLAVALAAGCGSHAGLNAITAQSPYIPSDMGLAVSPNVVLEGVNIALAWYNRANNQLIASIGLSQFFGPHGMCDNNNPSQGISDPRIRWDAGSQRFFLVATETATPGRWCLAVSNDPDGLAGWHFYAFQPPPQWFGTQWGQQYVFPDYPGIGIGDGTVTLTGNLANGFLGYAHVDQSGVLLINKADLVAGNPNPHSAWFNPTPNNVSHDSTHLFLLQPSTNLSGGQTAYTAGVNLLNNPSTSLRIWRYFGTPTDSVIPYATKDTVTVSQNTPFYQPPAGKQAGGLKVDQVDDRVMDVRYRGGQLWVTLNQGCYPAGDVDGFGVPILRTCNRYMQMDPNITSIVYQDFKLKEKKTYYYMPSINIDAQGNLVTGFNRSSPTEFIDGFVTGRRPTDPANTMRPETRVVASTVGYANAGSRWGDYSSASDETGGGTGSWFGLGYAFDANHWGTYISHSGPGNGYPTN